MGYWCCERDRHCSGAAAAFLTLLSFRAARPVDQEDNPTPPARCRRTRNRSLRPLGRKLAGDFGLNLDLIQEGRLELDGFERWIVPVPAQGSRGSWVLRSRMQRLRVRPLQLLVRRLD